MTDETLTIQQFCMAEKVSRSTLYLLWQEGRGPRFHLIGSQRRISADARREWRQKMEAEAMLRMHAA